MSEGRIGRVLERARLGDGSLGLEGPSDDTITNYAATLASLHLLAERTLIGDEGHFEA